jgi:hypothetical protein
MDLKEKPILQRSKRDRQASLHRRSYAQRFVNAAEIVMHEVERNRMGRGSPASLKTHWSVA